MKVKLTYFKPSGKYYSEGEYETQKQHVFEIFEEVRARSNDGQHPGLMPGMKTFTILVDPVGHPQGYPALIHPI